MPLFELSSSGIQPVDGTSFAPERIGERDGLQRVLRDNIDVIVPGGMVIAEEFADWEDSRRRIDLLCLDAAANLVVVELKRTSDSPHLELQAIRYAAMVATMTFEQAAPRPRTVPGATWQAECRGGSDASDLPWLG